MLDVNCSLLFVVWCLRAVVGLGVYCSLFVGVTCRVWLFVVCCVLLVYARG